MATARTTSLERPHESAVLVIDGQAVFRDFVEADVDVVDVLAGARDVEASAHRLLALGARAAGFVAASSPAGALEARLEAMTADVGAGVGASLSELQQAAAALFDGEDGELARTLAQFDGHLKDMLDPARRDSVAAELGTALRTVMERVLEAHACQVRRLVDPDAHDGPLGRVVSLVRDHTNLLGDEIRRLAEVVATDRARAEGLDASGFKGFSYEDVVFNVVSELAAVAGDAAEQVGRDKGSAGSLKGDIVVHLNPVDACGRAVCYALEAKTGKMGMRSSLEELDAVMANREALAAILVFADADVAPTRVPFQPYDNRALVVFDRSELDHRALRLGCLWARWVVRRQLSSGTAGPDIERMAAAIDRARRALGRAATIRRAHTTATKAIGEARSQVDELIGEVDAALRTLGDELGDELGE
jgi:hypothetical protein